MLPEQVINLIDSKLKRGVKKKHIELEFYNTLTKFLELKQFENFKHLIDYSDKLDIFIDLNKIPNRFGIISDLLMNCIREVSASYQTSSLGELIQILKFFNEFNFCWSFVTRTFCIPINPFC